MTPGTVQLLDPDDERARMVLPNFVSCGFVYCAGTPVYTFTHKQQYMVFGVEQYTNRCGSIVNLILIRTKCPVCDVLFYRYTTTGAHALPRMCGDCGRPGLTVKRALRTKKARAWRIVRREAALNELADRALD